jgi:hypothetical protein
MDRERFDLRPTVYIESTIPSFYHETRNDPDMVARTDWTREWWDHRSAAYDLVTSEAVLDELAHIRRVNTMLGLFVPTLATPLELLGREPDHEG